MEIESILEVTYWIVVIYGALCENDKNKRK